MNETSVKKRDAAPSVPSTPRKAIDDLAIIKQLTADAVAAEEFEKCVKYREYKSVLDSISAAVAAEEFEKCVELRAKKHVRPRGARFAA